MSSENVIGSFWEQAYLRSNEVGQACKAVVPCLQLPVRPQSLHTCHPGLILPRPEMQLHAIFEPHFLPVLHALWLIPSLRPGGLCPIMYKEFTYSDELICVRNTLMLSCTSTEHTCIAWFAQETGSFKLRWILNDCKVSQRVSRGVLARRCSSPAGAWESKLKAKNFPIQIGLQFCILGTVLELFAPSKGTIQILMQFFFSAELWFIA